MMLKTIVQLLSQGNYAVKRTPEEYFQRHKTKEQTIMSALIPIPKKALHKK